MYIDRAEVYDDATCIYYDKNDYSFIANCNFDVGDTLYLTNLIK
jgi:hypothetical protein